VQQRLAREVGVDRARVALVLVADHGVELLEAQRGHGELHLDLGRLDPHVGMGAREPRHGGRDDAQERGLERGDPDHAGRAAGREGGELGLGGLHAVEQRVRVADEHAAGLGQPDPAPGALEQRRTGLALEHAELLGDRAGRVVERPSRAVERAASLDLAQQAEPPQVEHRSATLHDDVYG
jgi:hypothetical protein